LPFKAPPAGTERLPLPLILLFSLPTIPLSALGLAMGVYLAPYFASHLGVSLTGVGLAFMIVRFTDMGVDVGLGAVMDRTRTRLGRYRLWLLVGMPVLAAGCGLLFMAPVGISVAYLVGGLLVYYFGTSIIGLAHPAWGAKLATHYNARSHLFGVQSAVGVLGAVAVLLIPIFAGQLGLTDAQAVPMMGWFVIASIPLSVIIASIATPEKVTADVHTHAASFKATLNEYIALITKPDLFRLVLAQVALTLGPGWMATLYLFFFRDFLGFRGGESSILLGVYIFIGILGAPAAAWLSARISKHRTLMLTTTAYSLGLCSIIVLPKHSMALTIPVMMWCGFMASGFGLMISAMLADVGDEVRLEQGKERISLIYAMNGLAAKVASALQLAITFPLLERLGYNPKEGAVNTPAAIHNLELAYIVGPIVFVMLGGACVIGWRLNAAKHADIRRALEERDGAIVSETSIIDSELGQATTVAVTAS
jgi:Na+/melibiose symporter-like transporter